MRISLLLTLIISIIFFSSCGEKMQELQQTADNLKNISQAADQIKQNVDQAEVKRQERVKRGDTLALDYKKLQEYLPTSIAGYTAEEPEGQSMNMGGLSVSTVSRNYTKPGKDGAKDYVKIELVDYNQAGQVYAGLTIWSAGFKSESNQSLEQTFDPGIQNVFGFEKYDKINKDVTVHYGIAWRFFVTVTANNQANTSFARQVFNNSRIKELVNM